LKLLVDLRSTVRISVSEAAVDRERPRENRRSSQWCEMIDPGFADSTLNSVTHGKKRAVLGAVGNSAGYLSLIGGGNSQRLHFAVKVAAFQPQSGGCLRHVPAVLLQFAQNKFPLIGAARFV